jgi:hypothetical protein
MSRLAFILIVLSLGPFLYLGLASGDTKPLLPPVPGQRYHAVTQATINSTICVSGWTATIRPPVSYTSALKKWLLKDRNLPGTVSDYQLDHLISLELGGAPYSTANLWMQDATQGHVDDGMENRLKRDVCAGKLTLKQGQRAELAWKRIQG